MWFFFINGEIVCDKNDAIFIIMMMRKASVSMREAALNRHTPTALWSAINICEMNEKKKYTMYNLYYDFNGFNVP